MRIAFIVNQFPALSETFILEQITALIDRGHEVDIYSNYVGNLSKVHPEVKSYNLLDRTFYAEMPKKRLERIAKATSLITTKYWKRPDILFNCLNVFKYKRKAASLQLLFGANNWIDKPDYDIIHCQLGFLGYDGILFKELASLKGKLITTFRGSDFKLYLKMFGQDYFDQLFEKCDLILTVCDRMKQQKIEMGCDPQKIVVHRSGINFERFVYRPRKVGSDGKVRLISIARLEENKGLEYSIKAVGKLLTEKQNIEYNILGDGTLMSELQEAIARLNAGNKIKLLGWKNRSEVIDILNQSHILVAPSVLGKNGTQEGIPNVIKEAMAMGLAVVSTYHSGIPELVVDGVSGFLVPERDVDALVDKLGYLVEHPELWPEMSGAGRDFLEEHYEINKLNDGLVEIYQQLIKQG